MIWFWLVFGAIVWVGVIVVIWTMLRSAILRPALAWIWTSAAMGAIVHFDAAFDSANADDIFIALLVGLFLLDFILFWLFVLEMHLAEKAEKAAKAEATRKAAEQNPTTEAQLTNRWLNLISFQMLFKNRHDRWW